MHQQAVQSAVRPTLFTIAIIAVSLFVGELVVMYLLPYLPPMSFFSEVLLDASVLVAFIIPVLYFFLYLPFVRHIDERDQMQADLRESHDRFILMLESLEAGVHVTRLDTYEVLYANRYMKGLFGEMVGRKCWEVLRGKPEGPCDSCNMKRLFDQKGNPTERQTCELEVEGEERCLEIRERAVRWVDGSWVCMGIATDITERKRHEMKLRLSERRMETLMTLSQATDIPVREIASRVVENLEEFTESAIGFYGVVNRDKTAIDMLAWSNNVMKQCAVKDKSLNFPLEGAGLWAEAYRHLKPVMVNDYTALHPAKSGYPEGHLELKNFLCVPVLDGERVVALAAVANKGTDYDASDVRELTLLANTLWRIVQRRQYQEELARINVVLRMIRRCNQTIVNATTEQEVLDRIIRLVVDNENYAKVWVALAFDGPDSLHVAAQAGFGEGEVEALFAGLPDSRNRLYFAIEAMNGNTPCIVDDIFNNSAHVSLRPGAEKGGYRSIVALPMSRGGRVYGVMTLYGKHSMTRAEQEVDVLQELAMDLLFGILTRRERAERRKMEKMMFEQEKLASIGTLSAGVAHEILNPLNIMSAIVQVMELDDLSDECKENLKEIGHQIQRAAKITNNLKLFSRQKTVEVTPIDLHALFDQTAALIERDLFLDNVTIEREYDPDLPIVHADADALAQVFLNLLNNAKDAMSDRKGGVVTLKTSRKNGNVEIAFGDTGHGMPKEIMQRVFNPFYTTKAVGKGTGLGLSMVQSIIERHGGEIGVQSEPGKGTVFTMSLPLRCVLTDERLPLEQELFEN